MTLLLFLIPLSLVLLAAAAWAFVWAVRRGQFDDMDTPAIDILRDDPHERPRRPVAPPPPPPHAATSKASGAAASGDLRSDPERDAHAN